MFSFSSIQEYHIALARGEISCVRAVDHYLDAIHKHETLNAFVEVFETEARDRALLLDRQSTRGKLHGVVIGIKDNICYKDHISSAGSRMLESYKAPYSATVIDRLEAEGAIIIGRQNCDEFGMGSTNEHSYYGPVPNPNDPTRVAGGSSGGSAAAVKAGLCMASLGSDTGGSVRLPADFCGVVGFKPSYGRFSRYGLIAYASSFDQIGILANCIQDIQLLREVMAGPDAYDSTLLPAEPIGSEDEKNVYRIAYFPEWLDHASMDPEIRTQLYAYIELLREKGHVVEPVSFPLTDYIVPAYYILTTAEASSNLARYDGARFGYQSAKKMRSLQEFYETNRTEGFGFEVKKRIFLGSFVLSSGFVDAYYLKALKVRNMLVQQTASVFQNFDFILAPNSPSIAYAKGVAQKDPLTAYLGDIFTVYANLCGLPAVSLPVFKHSSKITFGFQVHSSPQNEVSLLRFTHQQMLQ